MSALAAGRWTLGRESFACLLERLGPDDDRAAREYEAVRRKLVAFFSWRGSSWPEVGADKTIDRVARKLAEGARIDRLSGYFYGVARRVLQEEHRRRAGERAALAALQLAVEPRAPDDDIEAQIACLEHCIRELPEESRRLIVGYYESHGRSHIEGRKVLAARLGITYVTLKTRALRIRAILEAGLARTLRS